MYKTDAILGMNQYSNRLWLRVFKNLMHLEEKSHHLQAVQRVASLASPPRRDHETASTTTEDSYSFLDMVTCLSNQLFSSKLTILLAYSLTDGLCGQLL